MRRVYHGDVSSAARALLALPSTLRSHACQRMLDHAEMAARHVRETGKTHPIWGDGSLMSVARKSRLPKEPSFDDADYCQCFEMVLRSLVERVSHPARS